jgi:hypothetical protein
MRYTLSLVMRRDNLHPQDATVNGRAIPKVQPYGTKI